MICSNCRRHFDREKRLDGLPNGVSYILNNGKKITMCTGCLIKMGQMDDRQKEAFFAELANKVEQ